MTTLSAPDEQRLERQGEKMKSAKGSEKTRLQLSVRPITLVDQIAEALIETAAAGRILPGDRVVEVEVARELNISRVPVREALRLLQSQGIVVNMPYKGMRLMDVTPKKIHELLIVRAGLERIAAREAVPLYRRDTEVFAAIYAALEDMRRATIDGNGLAHARADIAFHRAICQACGNEVLLDIWETLSRKLTIIFGLAALPTRLDYVYKEHVAFFEILKSSNPAALDQAVDDHVIRSTEEIDFDRLIAERRKNHR